jgi:catechol 2,3-dioxygenase-like lactoylglutathione lyase family enzyme
MIRFHGINHLAMATGDMDKTVRFWRDLLGMRLVAGLGGEGSRHYFLQIDDRNLLAFFEWPGVKPMEPKVHGQPVSGPFIFDHVSFGVESEDELWKLKDKLAAAGVRVSDVIDHGFIHSIYAHDPNGIPIEFSADVPGRDVRKNPVIADDRPTLTAKEGSEPLAGKWPEAGRPTPPQERRIFPGAGSRLYSKEAGGHPV